MHAAAPGRGCMARPVAVANDTAWLPATCPT